MKNTCNINENIMDKEVGLITNCYKYKIDIYTPMSSDSIFILRRRSNQKLICKLDENFEVIGSLESLVLVKDLDIAIDRLREYVEVTGWVDDYFDELFDRM